MVEFNKTWELKKRKTESGQQYYRAYYMVDARDNKEKREKKK